MEDYSIKVAGLPDENLLAYVEQRHRYIPEIVKAAVTELQKRGRVFSQEELAQIYNDIEVKAEEDKQKDEAVFAKDQPHFTDDANAPEYYSPRLIRVFSVLFSVFFGSVMMAMNLSRTESKKGIAEVILFGLAYTAALIYIGSQLTSNIPGLGIGLNIAGGFVLEFLFWNKYIGKDTVYRKRPYAIPLVIGLVISALLIWVIISGMNGGINP